MSDVALLVAPGTHPVAEDRCVVRRGAALFRFRGRHRQSRILLQVKRSAAGDGKRHAPWVYGVHAALNGKNFGAFADTRRAPR